MSDQTLRKMNADIAVTSAFVIFFLLFSLLQAMFSFLTNYNFVDWHYFENIRTCRASCIAFVYFTKARVSRVLLLTSAG